MVPITDQTLFILRVVYRKLLSWSGFPVAQMVKNLPAKQETQVWSLVQKEPLEKGMATHSSFLPVEAHRQRNLGPGGLQSMGSQRVRHNWVTNTHTHIKLIIIQTFSKHLLRAYHVPEYLNWFLEQCRQWGSFMMRQAVWTRVFTEVFLTQWELRVCPEEG